MQLIAQNHLDRAEQHLYTKFRRLYHQTIFKLLDIQDCPTLSTNPDPLTYLPLLIRGLRQIQRSFKLIQADATASVQAGMTTQIITPKMTSVPISTTNIDQQVHYEYKGVK